MARLTMDKRKTRKSCSPGPYITSTICLAGPFSINSAVVQLLREAERAEAQEAKSTLFCPPHEKIHAVVLQGNRNISDTLENPPMKVLVQSGI